LQYRCSNALAFVRLTWKTMDSQANEIIAL